MDTRVLGVLEVIITQLPWIQYVKYMLLVLYCTVQAAVILFTATLRRAD
jgi:hypothetical protein